MKCKTFLGSDTAAPEAYITYGNLFVRILKIMRKQDDEELRGTEWGGVEMFSFHMPALMFPIFLHGSIGNANKSSYLFISTCSYFTGA